MAHNYSALTQLSTNFNYKESYSKQLLWTHCEPTVFKHCCLISSQVCTKQVLLGWYYLLFNQRITTPHKCYKLTEEYHWGSIQALKQGLAINTKVSTKQTTSKCPSLQVTHTSIHYYMSKLFQTHNIHFKYWNVFWEDWNSDKMNIYYNIDSTGHSVTTLTFPNL